MRILEVSDLHVVGWQMRGLVVSVAREVSRSMDVLHLEKLQKVASCLILREWTNGHLC